MKQLLTFVIVIMLVLPFTACGSPEEEPVVAEVSVSATPNPTVESTPDSTPESTPDQTPESTPDPYASKTTGLHFKGEYQPVLAVIENSPAARPQTGLQTADIVYEVPVEGSITRFVCVFSDNVPEEIMPVRSGRPPFLYIQHEWDAVFMHFGGSGCEKRDYSKPYSYYGHKLKADVKYDVDGWSGGWNDYYYRTSSASAPHNVVGNPLLVQELYDYEPEPISWLFDENVSYGGENVEKFNLEMCSGEENYITYEYDKDNDVYNRSMMGKVFKSKETNKQVTVKNIIVQYSTYETVQTIKLWNMIGSGKADYYIGGQLIHGTWERPTADDDTVFYDDLGKQIVLRPGNTWIHLHPAL